MLTLCVQAGGALGFATVLGVVVFLLDVASIVKIVSRGQDVEGSLAWIFAILAFPAIGAVAYLVLSGPSLRRTMRRRKIARVRVGESAALAPAARSSARVGSECVLKIADAITGLAPTDGNEVQDLVDNDEAFAELEQALIAAKHKIHTEYYLVSNDETGYRFLELLTQKAQQGLDVRFIYDSVGSFGLDRARLVRLKEAGAHVEAFLPMAPWSRRWALQQRNHRKIVVVDDLVAFTGGMNIGNEYSGRFRRKGKGKGSFRDTHVKITGPAVADLARVFREDWAFSNGETLPAPRYCGVPTGKSRVAIVPSGPEQEANANSLVFFSSITEARETLFLTSPYFIPDTPTLRALIACTLRGVDVRILVPGRCDVWIVTYAARTYYRALLRAGVRIFEYQRSMLHAKSIVVDRKFCVVGSANVDVRSFKLNFEVGAVIADEAFAATMEAGFLEDLEHSKEIKSADGAGRWRRLYAMRDQFARLLSPLL